MKYYIILLIYGYEIYDTLVGDLEHFLFFPYIGNNHPKWLSYLSEGVEATNQLWYIMIPSGKLTVLLLNMAHLVRWFTVPTKHGDVP